MPDNIIYVRPDLTGRQPALHGFIVRKLFAVKAKPGRQTIIEACRAELAWSVADWKRLNPFFHGWHGESEGMASTCRLPHEAAAGRVLNAWGHLHPIECRVRANLTVLRSQISAGWIVRAEATRQCLRLLLGDRRKAAKAFFAAVTEYRRLRLAIDTQVAA